MSKISDLVAFAKIDTNLYSEINFGGIPNFQAQEIAAKTGVTVKGAKKILSVDGIRHTITFHGNDALERQRGAFGVADSDFEHIPQILSEFDGVEKGNKGKQGYESVLFYKRINDKIYNVVMSLTDGLEAKNLVFTTMFINKKSR